MQKDAGEVVQMTLGALFGVGNYQLGECVARVQLIMRDIDDGDKFHHYEYVQVMALLCAF